MITELTPEQRARLAEFNTKSKHYVSEEALLDCINWANIPNSAAQEIWVKEFNNWNPTSEQLEEMRLWNLQQVELAQQIVPKTNINNHPYARYANFPVDVSTTIELEGEKDD